PRHDRVHRVAEFMKQRLDILMRKQRRLVFRRRWKVADQGDRRALVLSPQQQFASNEIELGKVVVLALSREHVQIKQAERLIGFGVRDGIELEIAYPFVRGLDAFKFQPEYALVNAEHSFQHALI